LIISRPRLSDVDSTPGRPPGSRPTAGLRRVDRGVGGPPETRPTSPHGTGPTAPAGRAGRSHGGRSRQSAGRHERRASDHQEPGGHHLRGRDRHQERPRHGRAVALAVGPARHRGLHRHRAAPGRRGEPGGGPADAMVPGTSTASIPADDRSSLRCLADQISALDTDSDRALLRPMGIARTLCSAYAYATRRCHELFTDKRSQIS